MGVNISRFVEIEVVNKTQNITLKDPRTHFYSGHVLLDPKPSVPPGSSSSCKFTNKSVFWGCNGVLAYEVDSFTLAIYFSNPIDYNRFSVEMGLELSLDKVHRKDLEAAYDRLVRISKGSANSSMFPCVILKENQDKVQLSHGPITVTATMARGRSAAIRVEVEEQKESGEEAEAEKPRGAEREKPWDVKGDRSKRSEKETGPRETLQDVLQGLKNSPGNA
ncbi:uncharacterized protein LOC143696667 [Agelaius phoeniceus]|uniref:uncharacterized protein LOC143696667 n=1 Tax=Agelaius phoeniceus TaxID=39638 RepID=UPI004054C1C5